MNTPEIPQRGNEQIATPEGLITEKIEQRLVEVRHMRQLVARGERTQQDLDTLKDRIHAELDEGIDTMTWYGERDEVGDLSRFDRG